MSGATKGPFAVRESATSNYLYEIVAPTKGGKQAVVARVTGGPFAESLRANAHLLAAAPELLSLVERARDLIAGDLVGAEWKQACHDFTRAARAALSAAGVTK